MSNWNKFRCFIGWHKWSKLLSHAELDYKKATCENCGCAGYRLKTLQDRIEDYQNVTE